MIDKMIPIDIYIPSDDVASNFIRLNGKIPCTDVRISDYLRKIGSGKLEIQRTDYNENSKIIIGGGYILIPHDKEYMKNVSHKKDIVYEKDHSKNIDVMLESLANNFHIRGDVTALWKGDPLKKEILVFSNITDLLIRYNNGGAFSTLTEDKPDVVIIRPWKNYKVEFTGRKSFIDDKIKNY